MPLSDKGCYDKDDKDDDIYYGGQEGANQYQSGLGYIAVWHIVLHYVILHTIVTMSWTRGDELRFRVCGGSPGLLWPLERHWEATRPLPVAVGGCRRRAFLGVPL